MADAREARRQRILARGADRLAYITGERKSIDRVQTDATATPPSAPPHHELTATTPQESHTLDAASRILENSKSEIETVEADQHEAGPRSEHSSHDYTSAAVINNISVDGIKRQESETSKADEILKSRINSIQIPPSTSVFSSKRLSASIELTEILRAVLAASVAVLAAMKVSGLFCHSFFAHLLDRLIPSWPISLVLITDSVLVLSVLFLGFVKTSSEDEKQSRSGNDNPSAGSFTTAMTVASDLEKFLDVILLLVKTFRAFFLDCSIYIVVLVSFLPFAHQWASRLC